MSTTTYSLDEVVLNFVAGQRVLDVGCGLGRWGHLIRVHSQTKSSIPVIIIGIDIERNYLKQVKYVYDERVLCDAAHMPFQSKYFEAVLATAIMEHLTKPNGRRLISECERVTSKLAVIAVPSPRTNWGSPEHISLWTPKEMTLLGYRVFGVRNYPRFASQNFAIQSLIAFIIGPLSYWIPAFSSYIVAVKALTT
jgi:ubiquinone/menaquinone biosynthesis C-methylase UbiE